MRKPPMGADCSIRAATFTAFPRMLRSPSTLPPSSTGPVSIPTRTSRPSTWKRASTSARHPWVSSTNRQTGSHGELRIVLASLVGAECGEEPVAGVVHDPATVELHSGGEPLQDSVHQLVDVLGVEPVGDGSGTDEVDEQDRRLSQLLVGSAGWEISCGELITERCQRQVGHRVADRVPLPLDRLDRGRDVLAVGTPVWHGRTLGRPFGGVTRSVSAGP